MVHLDGCFFGVGVGDADDPGWGEGAAPRHHRSLTEAGIRLRPDCHMDRYPRGQL